MRTTPLNLFGPAASEFDMMVRNSFESILGKGLDDIIWEQAKLSLNTGGVGLRPCTVHAHGAYVASVNLCTPLLNSHAEKGVNHFYDIALTALKSLHPNVSLINTSSQHELSKVIDEDLLMRIYDLATPSNKARLDAIRRPHANAWLSAPPCQMLNLELPNLEFQTSLFRWLGAPIPQADTSLCAACQTTLTPKAGHTTKCRHKGDIASRHNRIRDIVFALASNATWSLLRRSPMSSPKILGAGQQMSTSHNYLEARQQL